MRHIESNLQRVCVKWFRYVYPRWIKNLVAIPNGYKTSVSQARIAIAEGLTAGASDLVLFVASGGYHGLCIEMKTDKGRQSDNQKKWQQAVEQEGYKYVICRSVEDFQKEVLTYLK